MFFFSVAEIVLLVYAIFFLGKKKDFTKSDTGFGTTVVNLEGQFNINQPDIYYKL